MVLEDLYANTNTNTKDVATRKTHKLRNSISKSSRSLSGDEDTSAGVKTGVKNQNHTNHVNVNNNNNVTREQVKESLVRLCMRDSNMEIDYKANMKAWYNDALPDHWVRQTKKYKERYLSKYNTEDPRTYVIRDCQRIEKVMLYV